MEPNKGPKTLKTGKHSSKNREDRASAVCPERLTELCNGLITIIQNDYLNEHTSSSLSNRHHTPMRNPALNRQRIKLIPHPLRQPHRQHPMLRGD